MQTRRASLGRSVRIAAILDQRILQALQQIAALVAPDNRPGIARVVLSPAAMKKPLVPNGTRGFE